MLMDYLSPNGLKYVESANDWEDAIRIGSSQLVEDKQFSEKYVEQMIDNVKDLGPYIVIAPGIALAHSRPCEHVYQDCISFTLFHRPVAFYNEENDPVRLLIVFAAKKGNSHIDLIREISSFLDNEDFLNRLLTLKNADELKIFYEVCVCI